MSHFSSIYKETSVRTARCSGRIVGVRSQIKRPNLSPGSQLWGTGGGDEISSDLCCHVFGEEILAQTGAAPN